MSEPNQLTMIDRNVSTITPMDLLRTSVDRGDDLARIEKLMELERTWKADRAKEAFNLALAEFKKVPVTVTKDKENSQYSKPNKKAMYTSLGNLVGTVNAAMAPFGLSASWDLDQSTPSIKVTCVLTHTLGHSKSVALSGPPDKSGAKNPLQEIRSTITYLQNATFQAVTGVISQDATEDDDGNGSDYDRITERQVADLDALIDEVKADREKFLVHMQLAELKDMPAKAYKTAVAALQQKRKQAK